MDLLQEEQSSEVRFLLTCTDVQLQQTCAVIHGQYAPTKGVHLLEKARPESEMTGTGFFQRKSKPESRV